MYFAQNLKNIMDSQQITMYRLAKELEVHPSTIKNWLSGKTSPQIEMLRKISKILDVSVDWLLGRTQQE